LESLINNKVKWRHAGPGYTPGNVFKGNFAPVKEDVLEADLPVEGTLPAALDGAYIRNGPNPYLQPLGGFHW
jgi:carotenoid cleavage dioxygenase-like enzyme